MLKPRSFREDGIYMLASFIRTRSTRVDSKAALPRAELHSNVDPKEARASFEDTDLRVAVCCLPSSNSGRVLKVS